MQSGIRVAVIGSILFLCGTALMVDAATIRIRCEQRTGRSTISVDGRELARGNYRAQVMSGANQATSAYQPAVGGEADFDFDSDPGNIAAGATRITSNFIQGGQVTGKILNAGGSTVIMDTVKCRIRN